MGDVVELQMTHKPGNFQMIIREITNIADATLGEQLAVNNQIVLNNWGV
jgi:hypothetical protein